MPHSQFTRSTPINFAASGDNTVIANSGTNALSVYCMFFTVAGATNLTFKDSVYGAFSGAMIFTGNGSSMTLGMVDEPYFFCQPGSAFVINSSNAVQVSGVIYYTKG